MRKVSGTLSTVGCNLRLQFRSGAVPALIGLLFFAFFGLRQDLLIIQTSIKKEQVCFWFLFCRLQKNHIQSNQLIMSEVSHPSKSIGFPRIFICFIDIILILTRMRYITPSLLPSFELDSSKNHNSYSTQQSYVSRGEFQTLTNYLLGLQALLMGDQEESLLQLLELDEQIDSTYLGLIRRSMGRDQNTFQPDQKITEQAIKEYEQQQQHLTKSLRQNIATVKANRQVYQHIKMSNLQQSWTVKCNKTIMGLLDFSFKQSIQQSGCVELQGLQHRIEIQVTDKSGEVGLSAAKQ